MKIFVTGATGFIGRHLCQKLDSLGHEVIAMVRTPKKASVLPKSAEVFKGDLASFSDPNLKLPECDIVIHLAAIIAGKDEADYIQTNYESVKDFVECLDRQSWKPKHFLFASSLAAGGPTTRGNPIDETMEPKPVDHYGVAKWKAEQYLQTIQMPTTSFRPGIVLGPEDSATFTLYEMAKMGMGIKPIGEPQRISFIYVDDLIDGIIVMMNPEAKPGEHTAYYVSHPTYITNVDLFMAMGKAFGKTPMILPIPRFFLKSVYMVMTGLSSIFGFTNQIDEKQYKQIVAEEFTCSSEKLRTELNWNPEIDLEVATIISVEGYKKAGWL